MLLSDAIDQYNADRRAKGMSASTVRNQGTALRQFLAVVGNIHVHYIGPKHVDKLWQAFPDWSEGTYNLKRSVLMSFFEWLRQRGHMQKGTDPMVGLRKRRVPQNQWQIIPTSRFEETLDAAPNPRDRAMVALSLYLFTRVSETSNLRWRDVDLDRHTIEVYRQKTGEFDVLPMCEELERELRRWHLEYGRLAGQVPRPEWYICPPYTKPLFKGRSGGGLHLVAEPTLIPGRKLTNITPIIKATLNRIGLDGEKEGGHTLRRSGATGLYHELARVGHDKAVRTVQAMLGHKNITTTEIYLSLDVDRKARNDLLAGKKMFAVQEEAVVVEMEIEGNGRTHTEAL